MKRPPSFLRPVVTGLLFTLLAALACGLLDWVRLLRMTGASATPLRDTLLLLPVALFYYAVLGLLVAMVTLPVHVALRWPRVTRSLHAPTLGVAIFLSAFAVGQGFVWSRSNMQSMRQLSREDLVFWLVLCAFMGIGAGLGWGIYALSRRIRALAGRKAYLAAGTAVALWGILSFALGLSAGTGQREGIGVPVPAESGFLEGARPAATANASNVILITIETTRSDHVNFMSYGTRETTPHLDRIAARGVVFDQAFSPAPWTRPAMASVFSSLYPSQHGVRSKGASLGRDVRTLPRVLEANGYRTVTFYANNYAYSPSFGFGERCGSYRPPHTPSLASLWIDLFIDNALRLLLRVTLPWDQPGYNGADLMNRAVVDWLQQSPPTPAFVHIHYVDPHEPYMVHPRKPLQWDPRARWNRDSLLERYDGEIRHVDEAIGRVLDEFGHHGWLEGSLVIITADHGEEFLDHGGWGHRQSLYDELLHVPLIVYAPGRLAAGQRVATPVSLVDVAPTVLDFLGLQVPATYEGVSLLRTLAAQDGQQELPEQRAILAQREGGGHNDALISGPWKLIRNASGRAALFHRETDPAEQQDLSREQPEVLASLEARLDQILTRLQARAPGSRREEPSEEELRQLRTLGYVE